MTRRRNSLFRLSESEVERIRKMVPTVAELRIIDLMRDYRAIRNAYFGGTIPPVEEVLIRLLPRHEIDRFVERDDRKTEGICLAGKHRKFVFPYVIALADDLDTRDTRTTLLHEMAHMKINKKFGRKMGEGNLWKREIRRLVRIGAYDGWM